MGSGGRYSELFAASSSVNAQCRHAVFCELALMWINAEKQFGKTRSQCPLRRCSAAPMKYRLSGSRSPLCAISGHRNWLPQAIITEGVHPRIGERVPRAHPGDLPGKTISHLRFPPRVLRQVCCPSTNTPTSCRRRYLSGPIRSASEPEGP